MKTWIRKTINVGVLAAGAILLTAGAASAAPVGGGHSAAGKATQIAQPARHGGGHGGGGVAQISSDNDGVLNGNQVYVPVQVPVNICGNGVGVVGVGVGLAGCSNGAQNNVDTESARTEGAGVAQVSHDNDGVLNGNQVYVPVQVPVNVCGNGVSVLLVAGIGIGSCSNGAVDNVDSGDHNGGPDYRHNKEAGATDALPFAMPGGDGNMLGKLPLAGALGNLTPGSNAVNVGGLDAGNLLSNAGGSVAPTEAAKDKKAKKATKAPAAPKMNPQVSQMASILQPAPAAPKAAAPQVAPAPRYDGGDHGHGGAGVLQLSNDNDGVGNGNQVYVPVQIPVNVCGNGVGVVGVGLGIAGCSNGAVDNAQESAGLTEGNFLAETVTATRELF